MTTAASCVCSTVSENKHPEVGGSNSSSFIAPASGNEHSQEQEATKTAEVSEADEMRGSCSDLGRRVGGRSETTGSLTMAAHHKMKSSLFFNAMSHELRTPMAIVVSNLELLESMITSSVQLECLADARKGGDDVLKKMDNMLAYASLMEGLTVVNKVARPFVSFTREIVEEYQVTYGRTIGFTSCANVGGVWCFDRNLVSSVIRNILDNSVQCAKHGDQISVRLSRSSAEELSKLADLLATEPNGVTSTFDPVSSMVDSFLNQSCKSGTFSISDVTSSCSQLTSLTNLTTAPTETWVALELIDSGPGIASPLLPEIFKPFRDFNHGATGSTTGCGSGLPLSRLMARSMGGEIMAESPWPPGAQGGTKVLVLLPMKPVEE